MGASHLPIMKPAPRTQLVAFAFLAFVIAWGAWIPALTWPSIPKTVPLVGLFGPALAAAIVGGGVGVRDVAARLRRWRFPVIWYAVATLVMPVCYAVAIRVDGFLFGLDQAALSIGHSLAFLAASFAWLLLVTAGEEIGWRGFALPRLLDLGMSRWSASLALGIVWALWHLPLYLVPGQSSMPYSLFVALTVGQSLVYTSLYLQSGGSLLPALLLHATTDFGARLYRIDRFDRGTWLLIDVLVAAAGFMLLRIYRPAPLPANDHLRVSTLDAERARVEKA